jgi:D-alanyl-D-alanine carboxypeptidase
VTPPVTRRDARAAHLLTAASAPVRHARARRADRIRFTFACLASVALGVGGAAAITSAVIAPDLSPSAGMTVDAAPEKMRSLPMPQPVAALPAPTLAAAPALVDLCADPAFVAALAAGDDSAAIAAAGGGEAFRTAVATGHAPCAPLADPARVWAVVNKGRPSEPVDFHPGDMTAPAMRDISGGRLRADAAAALAEMAAAATAAGAGEIALASGFRSYATQRSIYQRQVASHGRPEADKVSARPGHSEHQSGLAADVTACSSTCADMGSFGGTPQQEWVAAHSWEYGWIVRYVSGGTPVTGYSSEPWHLRFIGRDLAAAYHEGGWQSLEEFFGLPATPDYGS